MNLQDLTQTNRASQIKGYKFGRTHTVKFLCILLSYCELTFLYITNVLAVFLV